MKRFIPGMLFVLLIVSFFWAGWVYAANEWKNASTSFIDETTVEFNDVADEINDHIIEPLDRMLAEYRQSVKVEYLTAATLTVTAGEVMVSNSGGTLRKMRRNTSNTTVTWSNLDTGSEAASTTYYVYALGDADATTFTVSISKSSSAPSGATYYVRLGSFYNDASSNIANDYRVSNDDDVYGKDFTTWTSKSVGTTYQATTDGFVVARIIANADDTAVTASIKTDSSSTPATTRTSINESGVQINSGTVYNMTVPVKKGDYYKVAATNHSGSTVYFLPNE